MLQHCCASFVPTRSEIVLSTRVGAPVAPVAGGARMRASRVMTLPPAVMESSSDDESSCADGTRREDSPRACVVRVRSSPHGCNHVADAVPVSQAQLLEK